MTKIVVFPSGKVVITTKERKPYIFRWSFNKQSFVEGFMARITTEQQVSVSVQPQTQALHPAPIDGQVELTVSDPTVVSVTRVDATNFILKGVLTAAIGNTPVPVQVIASFDADLGDGVTPVELSGVLEVAAPQATTGVLTFGAPELQP